MEIILLKAKLHACKKIIKIKSLIAQQKNKIKINWFCDLVLHLQKKKKIEKKVFLAAAAATTTGFYS